MNYKTKDENAKWKTAHETADDAYEKNLPFLTVDEDGIPNRNVKIDLIKKDLSIHWKSHEPKLWFIAMCCSLYLLYIIVAY